MPIFFWMCFVIFGVECGVSDQYTRDRKIIEGLKHGVAYEMLEPGRFRTDDPRYLRLNRIARREMQGNVKEK